MPPYGGRHHHHHDLSTETMMSPEDAKVMESTKGYHYGAGMIYDGQHDSRAGVETFTHHHGDHEPNGLDTKTKSEFDGGNASLPSIFHPGPLMVNRRCGPFDVKPRSDGYYPSLASQSGINISNIT